MQERKTTKKFVVQTLKAQSHMSDAHTAHCFKNNILIMYYFFNWSQSYKIINIVQESGWEFTKLLTQICNIFCNFKMLLQTN